MPLATWDATYRMKITQHDEDHPELFSLLNTLIDAMKSGKGAQIIRQVVDDLALSEWEVSGKLEVLRGYYRDRNHHEALNPPPAPLASLVHLSDLLCRLRDLGYGYYEAMGVELSGSANWKVLVDHYPALANIDLARLSMDIEEAMEEIVATVDGVYAVPPLT